VWDMGAEEIVEQRMGGHLNNLRTRAKVDKADPGVLLMKKHAPEMMLTPAERKKKKVEDLVEWSKKIFGPGRVPVGIKGDAKAKDWVQYLADLRRYGHAHLVGRGE
jgi:hypothetical protein